MHRSLMVRFPRAEEVNDASRTLPKALFWGVALNAVLGYLAIFTLCFTIDDPKAILSGATGYPFIQLFYNVTKSYAGTNVMVAIIIITLVAAGELGTSVNLVTLDQHLSPRGGSCVTFGRHAGNLA